MMETFETLGNAATHNWHVWLVSVVLIVAAVIDGVYLKVPNWLTFPMIISGWIYCTIAFAVDGSPETTWYGGLAWSLMGTALGLCLLLPFYAIGGMGAGDVKLLAGVGAWVLCETTFYAFAVSAVIGAVIALGMVLYRRSFRKHTMQARMILNEILTIRNPEKLAELAAERKSSMLLLPYGIPIAIGSILYFACMGMLI